MKKEYIVIKTQNPIDLPIGTVVLPCKNTVNYYTKKSYPADGIFYLYKDEIELIKE